MLTSLRLGAFLALTALVAAHTPPAGTLHGAVLDDATGEPIPGANVLVVGTSIGTSTDRDGQFTLADVPDGLQEIRVSSVGYTPQTLVVDVRDGADVRHEFRMSAADVAADEVVVTGEAAEVRGAESASAFRIRGGRAVDGEYHAAPPPPAAIAPRSSASPEREAGESDRRSSDDRFDRERRQPGLLTAGDIDDGLNWDAYLGYVRRTLGRQGESQRQRGDALPDFGLSDRLVLTVEDQAGAPVAGARVTVEARGGNRARRLVTEAGTDGRLALFPTYDFGGSVRELRIRVEEPGGGRRARTQTIRLGSLSDDRAVSVRLPIRIAERPRALDLAFVIDVTGSMGDELRYLTDEFEHIVERIEAGYPGVDLRFGLVAYRDHGDQFVVQRHDFTRSAQEMQRRLRALRAQGGGDYPEAMDEALEAALDLDWRTGTAARVAFLVADAPPHDDRVARTMDAVREARARGLRLYPVAASGVADEAEYVMRTAAVLTQARHLFLTDDSGVGLSHAEPKIACYQVTPLNSLLTRVIASELEGRRVEASRREVIREVGDYDAGVCEPPVVVQRPVLPPRQSRRSRSELGYVEVP